ncbi:hypothetical protein MKX03_004498, partial [Papaver bracteatum]
LITPDQSSGKIEYAGLASSIGLTTNHVVNFSSLCGNNQIAAGTDVSFDTISGNFVKYNAGLSLARPDLLEYLLYHTLTDPINASADAELIKAKLNNLGIINALIQHKIYPKSYFTISGEVDTKAI